MLLKKFVCFCLCVAGMVLIHSLCAGAPLMVDKNLFAQDRKPPPPESANTPTQPNKPNMPITNIQLDGIMVNGETEKGPGSHQGRPGGRTEQKGPVAFRDGSGRAADWGFSGCQDRLKEHFAGERRPELHDKSFCRGQGCQPGDAAGGSGECKSQSSSRGCRKPARHAGCPEPTGKHSAQARAVTSRAGASTASHSGNGGEYSTGARAGRNSGQGDPNATVPRATRCRPG